MQEKFFENGFKELGSIDALDPALDVGKHDASGRRVTDPKARQVLSNH
jgi:hypothetical protein